MFAIVSCCILMKFIFSELKARNTVVAAGLSGCQSELAKGELPRKALSFYDTSVLRELVDTASDKIKQCSAKTETKNEFISVVNNVDFWYELQTLIKFFDPIAATLTKAEGNFIENGYKDMFNIYHHVESFPFSGIGDKKSALQIVLKRWNFIFSDTMGFAFLLNPITAGQNMLRIKSPIDGKAIDDYEDINRQLKAFLCQYFNDPKEAEKAKDDYSKFVQEFASTEAEYIEEYEDENPRVYWAQHGKRNYPTLYKLASRLFQMPVGAISSEQTWSAFNFVYTKARNRLTSEALEKLVFIYVNAKLLDHDDKTDYNDDHDFFGVDDKDSD